MMHKPAAAHQLSLRVPGTAGSLGHVLRTNALRIAILTIAAGKKRVPGLAARQVRRALGCSAGQLAAASALHLGFLGLSRQRRRPSGGRAGGKSASEFGAPARRATDFLLLLNAAVFLAQMATSDKLLLWGAKDNQLIRSGQWWRLITPVALHANVLHLLTNNYSLNSLGPVVEALSGRQRFVSVYAASAIMGAFASYVFNTSPSVGASGAIFGLGGALAVYCARHRELMGKRGDAVLQSLGQSLLLNMAIGLTSPRVDQWGHMGGLVGGALTAYFLGPHLKVVKGGRARQLIDSPPVPIFASKL